MKLRYVLFPSVHYGCRTPNEKIFLYSHNIISIDIFLSFVVTFFYDNHCFGWKPKRSLLNPQKSLVSPSKEIETIKLPVKDPKSPRGIAIETFEIIHPHRILAFLFNDVGIRISKADVKAYWEHSRARGEPWAIQSPASSEHIPLGIHGDSARLWTVYKFEKVLGLFINLVHFRPRSVRHSRWLLFSIANEKLYKNRTMNLVWRRLAWSLNCCFEGVNPIRSPVGTPLRGKQLQIAGKPITTAHHKFCLTEYRGDWEWHRDVWRPRASWVSTRICFKCPALASGGPSYLYHNVGGPHEGHACQWIQEEYSLSGFLAHSLKDKNLCG